MRRDRLMAVLNFGNIGFAREDYTNGLLLGQMRKQQQDRLSVETQRVSDTYQGQINEAEAEMASLQKFKEDIGAASSFLAKTVGQAKSILSKIDAAIRLVVSAEQADSGFASYGKTLDGFLKRIEADTESGGVTSNPMSHREPDYFYQTRPNGGGETAFGRYLGTKYQIVDDTGKVWVPDTSAGLLREYNSYPEDPTGTNYSLEHGVELTAESGNDITFVLNPDSASPDTRTGTVTRKGLQVMGAWYYDHLQTAAGRSAAHDDLNDAKVIAKIEVSRYELAFKVAQFHEEEAQLQIGGLRGEVNDLQVERAREIQEMQNRLAQEFEVANVRVQTALSLRNDYKNFLGVAVGNNKVAQALLSIYA